MSEHTPGPWRVATYPALAVEGCRDGGWDGIATVRRRDPLGGDYCDAEANARLIAAGPDLLEASLRFLGALDAGISAPTMPEYQRRKDALRDAIRKAKGEGE